MMKSIAAKKLGRLRDYMAREGYTGMVLMRKDNFAWLTTGGNSNVILPDATGMCAVVVTQQNVRLVAQVMDGARLMDEDACDLGAEYVPLHWYEDSVADTATVLAGDNPVSDVPFIGRFRLGDIYQLHYPFFDIELDRMRELGRIADETMTAISLNIEPGMTDYQVQAMMLGAFARRGVSCDVVLVGADDRAMKYRHPEPSGRRIERYVLFSPALRFHGLHCNLARSVCFGDKLPGDLSKAYDAVCRVQASCCSMLDTGVSYADILKAHRDIFRETGFSEEWRNHYPGGRVGYYICQSDLSLDRKNAIRDTDAFEWFITLPGVKIADLVIKQGDRVEIASNGGLWPSQIYQAKNGRAFNLPQIMLR